MKARDLFAECLVEKVMRRLFDNHGEKFRSYLDSQNGSNFETAHCR